MAAPCGRTASRGFMRVLSTFPGATGRATVAFRRFGASAACRATPNAKSVSETARCSPYRLCAAVCLQRLPVISADCTGIEQSFKDMMHQMELEKSLLSDHELRLMEDADRLRRKQAEDYESDEEDGPADQDIVLARDLEDAWEQRSRSFQPAPRVRDDLDKDLSFARRCLADSLVLVAQQKVGHQEQWLLPQTQWREGETLRQTAERALAALPVGLAATFLGNAPCGVYKSKPPKPPRADGSPGTKVFFFKAVLSPSSAAPPPDSALLWLKRAELRGHLKAAYAAKVEQFILDL